MKQIIAAAILAVAIHAPAMAQDADQPVTCADMGNLAESIMVARQNGIPISQLVVIIDAAEDSPGANRLYRSIVLEAYERPRFMSASSRTRSIEDFRNDIETFCFASGFGG